MIPPRSAGFERLSLCALRTAKDTRSPAAWAPIRKHPRCDGAGPLAPDDRFDNVFAFGGSTTFGYDVPDAAIFSDRLNDFVHCRSPRTHTLVAAQDAEAAKARSLPAALRALPPLQRLDPAPSATAVPKRPPRAAGASLPEERASGRGPEPGRCDPDEAVDAVTQRYGRTGG